MVLIILNLVRYWWWCRRFYTERWYFCAKLKKGI